jgi:hypothetical protein
MKGFKALTVLWALLVAGCALPLGEDYLITRDGGDTTYITDYNLQNYVPVPKPGERPITLADREDLEIEAVWMDETGLEAAFEVFAADTVYRAEIRIRAKSGYGFYPSTPFAYPPGKAASQAGDLGDPVRTIGVTYHNSDEWNVTYIIDYNLQNYVPVPLAGEKPVRTGTRGELTVRAAWQMKTSPGIFGDIPGYDDPDFRFQPGIVYRAEIALAAVSPEYRFSPGENFAYPDGVAAVPRDDGADPVMRRFVVTYPAARTPTIINDRNLTPWAPRPVIGTMAITGFVASQYTGTVTWRNTTGEPLTGPFQPDTAYIAELTLRPASGYTVKGLGRDVFIHTGAGAVANGPDSNVVTITFPATGSYGSPTVVYDTTLTGRLPRPVSGMTPVMNVSGPQYTGAVSWAPFHSVFQEGTVYRAVLTLKAAPSYTFNGIGRDAFTHGDAAAVSNPAGSGTVTITFPVSASSSSQGIAFASFGPVEDEASALWMMQELKDDAYPLTIDLPDNAVEELAPDRAVLEAGINSPVTVIINGRQGTLKINSPGTLLEVGDGVTLTLQNITLEGRDDNHAPLIRVTAGGRLVLGTGAVLTGNESSGNAGGVWVADGTLVLNEGGVIKNMSAASPSAGGGVLIDASGTFLMNNGIIEYNRVMGVQSGGGVYVAAGAFFEQRGGVITNNTADDGTVSGGGVYLSSGTVNFTMMGSARVAEDNTVFLNSYAVIITGDVLNSPVAANIIVAGSPAGRHMVGAPSVAILNANIGKFLYDGESGHIIVLGIGRHWYGYGAGYQ